MKHHHTRCVSLPFNWPNPSFQIALVEPEIPPNTGTIARLCAATNTPLHLVEPLGFSISDSAVKRAGLDYWKHVNLTEYDNFSDFIKAESPDEDKLFFFSKTSKQTYFDANFPNDSFLIFGSETQGLPQDIFDTYYL